MKTTIVLLLLLVGCSSTPDVERAWAQCLAFGGSPTFTVAGDARKAECRRAEELKDAAGSSHR